MKKAPAIVLIPLTMSLVLSSCTLTFVLEPECAYYDGAWSGVTSQGLPVTFEVVDNELTYATFDYEIRWQGGGTVTTVVFEADPYCSSCGPEPIPIEEGSFSATFDLPHGGLCSVTGYFGSEYLVSGDLVLWDDCCYDEVEITWNAEVD